MSEELKGRTTMKRSLAILVCASILQGCFSGPESSLGFRLPDGDAEKGMQAFHDLQCYGCHTVQGMKFPPGDADSVSVVLGGNVTRVKTYGELVTSIINPSHKLARGYKEEEVTIDGASRMELAYLNDVVTVQQLIDLVVFLQPLYHLMPPENNPYRYMYP
jgi:hypothetical protein